MKDDCVGRLTLDLVQELWVSSLEMWVREARVRKLAVDPPAAVVQVLEEC